MSPPWLTSTTSASARKPAPQRDGLARPAARRKPRRRLVGDHIDRAVLGAAGGDEAAGVGALAGRCRRIDRDDDARAAAAPPRRGTSRSARATTARRRAPRRSRRRAPGGRAACRHSGATTASRNAGARLRALATVAARVTAVFGSAISRLISAIGRGVVVMTCRGRSPRRSPNCNMSNVASAWRHLASSSHQAAANCGPRRLSGSSAENTCATAPLGHSSRRRDGIQCGRSPRAMHRQQPGHALDHHLARVVLGFADQRDRAALRRRRARSA